MWSSLIGTLHMFLLCLPRLAREGGSQKMAWPRHWEGICIYNTTFPLNKKIFYSTHQTNQNEFRQTTHPEYVNHLSTPRLNLKLIAQKKKQAKDKRRIWSILRDIYSAIRFLWFASKHTQMTLRGLDPQTDRISLNVQQQMQVHHGELVKFRYM